MSFLQIIKSIISAIFGVRSQKEAETDFSHIDIRWYLLFACIIVVVVIVSLALLVKIIV